MSQKLIKCSDTKCPRFFVDTKDERDKAINNGWTLDIEDLGTCGQHNYRLFAEAGVE